MPADRPAAVVAVHESSLQRDGLYGFLAVASVAVLVRVVLGGPASPGGVVMAVLFGALLLVVLRGWFRAWRHPDRLEVSPSTVRYVPGDGGTEPGELHRADGAELRFVVRGGSRAAFLELDQVRSAQALPLRHFRRASVRRACVNAGWQL